MKLKATIISLISVFIIGLSGILLYCYWPAIKGTVDESKYYTAEELQESYNKGYDDGCKSETELLGQVKYYKELVDEYYIQVNTLNNEITMLTTKNNDYKSQITSLNNTITELETQVTNLTTIKANNEETITQLNSQITSLQNEVAELENDNEDKDTTITQKNSQIASLQTTVSQLQRTNELNNETITSLNNQISSLNSQISDMTMQIQNNSSNVTALNNKIVELEKSVSYYEQYIANLENGEQVVATFEFNGSVYNIQIVNKNDTVSVVNPTSTDYVIFNYWTVNGEQIDLSTYRITTNTKIVANVTYNYDVKFMVDNEEYNSQIVVENGYATVPANPTKVGYDFDGWTVNGIDIIENIDSTAIKQNLTYVAKFTKLHTVTFMYEDTIKNTQTVKNGETATNITVDSTTYKVFNGWKLNDTIVDITSQKIVADTTFIADITYYYDVKFMVDNTEYNSQIVVENGYAIVPANPTKEGYEFVGWTTNGVDIVSNINITKVIQNVTYYVKFTEIIYEFSSASWEEISYLSTSGLASKYFSVGDEKDVQLSTGEYVTLVILGFNHDTLSDGTGTAGISIGMKQCLTANHSLTTNWENSSLRLNTMEELYLQLPTTLQSAIKTVSKNSLSYSNGDVQLSTTNDKLFIFSISEIFSLNNISNDSFLSQSISSEMMIGEGSQYEYFAKLINSDISAGKGNEFLIKYLSNGVGNKCGWLTRSRSIGFTYGIWLLGQLGGYVGNEDFGGYFGFCI